MFDYIYENTPSNYLFFKLPQMLFTEPLFEPMSNEAKLLYGLLLDRSSLSARNGWQDGEGHIFINYKNAEICQKLHIGPQKAVKILRELEQVGLIERERIGLGKPDRIYVMQFCNEASSEQPEETIVESLAIPMQNDEIHHSGISEIETPEFPESAFSHNNNQTDTVRTISSDPSYPAAKMKKESISPQTVESYREQIKANIEYDWFVESYAGHDKIGGSQEELDELVEIMTECACATKPVRIHGQEMPAEIVKSRMLKIGSEHIQYIFDCLSRTTTKIANIKAYLLTALYNAPTTISNYYSTLVRHHMYCRE